MLSMEQGGVKTVVISCMPQPRMTGISTGYHSARNVEDT